jgi:hypothetical protein
VRGGENDWKLKDDCLEASEDGKNRRVEVGWNLKGKERGTDLDYKCGRSEELNTNGRKSISERALHKQSATFLLFLV